MKRCRSLIIAAEIIFFISVLISCTDEWRRTQTSETWKSSDPMSIPYNVRMKEYKSGNLVPNSSFEEGTPLSSDTSTVQAIKKWEIIGKNVKFIEEKKDSLNKGNKNRFVFIKREQTNETDSIGEGILSEYIPVIPGNYSLSLKMKALNIRSQFQRFGSRLNDAINIRLFFYNNRREEISPSMFDPATGNYIDNGFWGTSFAGLYSIDHMPWTVIRARAGIDPLIDGDIPDECRYVRIFIGLKGTGSLWIDDVNFSYSRLNFSAKERISREKDSVYSKTDLLIPTPHFVKSEEKIPLISAGFESIRYPTVVLDQAASNLNLYTQKYLAEQIEASLIPAYPECQVNQHNSINKQVIDESSIIFLLTSYQTIDTLEHAACLPGFSHKNQGYIITDTIIEKKRTIILAGKDETGLFYAATTVVRLLDPVIAMYHHAHVIDFPEFEGRGFQFSHWEDMPSIEQDLKNLDFLTYYRFNKAYVPVQMYNSAGTNQQTSQIFQYGTKQIAQYAEQKGTIDFGVMVNPYAHSEVEENVSDTSHSIEKLWQHDEKGINAITDKIKPLFDQGADFLMLLSEEFSTHANDVQKVNNLLTKKDLKMHSNLQIAHTFLIRKLNDWLLKNYGSKTIEFGSPWRSSASFTSGQGFAEVYLRDLSGMIPDNVVFIRELNSNDSPDALQRKRIRELHQRNTMLWDNTLLASSLNSNLFNSAQFPGKIKLKNLFEPYEITMADSLSSASENFFTSLIPNTEIAKIKFATLSDYLWNPEAYVPELSLWKILNSMFGREVALQLVEFNDLFFKVYGSIVKMEKEGKEANSLKKNTEYAVRKLFSQIDVLRQQLHSINNELIVELETLCLEVKDRLDQLQSRESEIKKTETTPIER